MTKSNPVPTTQEQLIATQESEVRLKKARAVYGISEPNPRAIPISLKHALERAIVRAEEWLELAPEASEPELRLLISGLKSEHCRVVRLGRKEVDYD